MENTSDIERYVKDPDLLVKLLQDVIEFLESDDEKGESTAMEAQLREISKAMEKLEKINVLVPDALRAEKTRLVVALGSQSTPTQKLTHLSIELEKSLKDLQARIGLDGDKKSSKKKYKRSHTPRTEKVIMRNLIVDALKHLGGSAPRAEVLNYIEQKLEGKFLPGDLAWHERSKSYSWQQTASWERFVMTNDGLIKTGSPSGIWELSEEYL